MQPTAAAQVKRGEECGLERPPLRRRWSGSTFRALVRYPAAAVVPRACITIQHSASVRTNEPSRASFSSVQFHVMSFVAHERQNSDFFISKNARSLRCPAQPVLCHEGVARSKTAAGGTLVSCDSTLQSFFSIRSKNGRAGNSADRCRTSLPAAALANTSWNYRKPRI